jgi:peroxiredoxin
MKSIVLLVACSIASVSFAQSLQNFETHWYNNSQSTVYKSNDYLGSVTVIEIFNVYCPQCAASAVNFNHLADDFANDARVQVIAMGTALTERDARRWISHHEPHHPILGGRRSINEQLGVRGTPTFFVLDCARRVTYQYDYTLTESQLFELRAAVRQALESPSCL